MARHTNSRVSRGKVLLTLAVVAAGATAVGAGTYASFTSSTAQSLSVNSGTQSLGFVTNTMTVNATNIVPGDVIERVLDLKNTGNVNLSAITLTTNATTSSLLNTNTTFGLQLLIQECSAAWTGSDAAGYTCGGTTTTVLASTPVIGSGMALAGPSSGNLNALTANGMDRLKVKLTFPSTANDTYQNQSSVINFTFNGAQRTAGNA